MASRRTTANSAGMFSVVSDLEGVRLAFIKLAGDLSGIRVSGCSLLSNRRLVLGEDNSRVSNFREIESYAHAT